MLETIIFETAKNRLLRKFSESQSNILATLIYAQSEHETAKFTSNVFKQNKNLFGYKYTSKSIYQIGKGNGSPEGDYYGKYPSYEYSVLEISDWIGRRKQAFEKVVTPEDYAKALKNNGYYGASLTTYTNALIRYVKALPDNFSEYIKTLKKKVFQS